MKSTFFNPLLSLATSVLLLSVVNKASAAVTQPSLDEPQVLTFDLVNSDRTSSAIPNSKNPP
ncbi:MAG: hypothetical protein WA828_01045, partial [Coleofasciculaceae cyanobacterium]